MQSYPIKLNLFLKTSFRISLLVFSNLLLFTGCGRDMSFKKFYHNTTAHYNGYFNALVKYEEAVQDIQRQHIDAFDGVLPVFVYGSQAASANFYANFDEVIKKCSNVIQNHDISNWIDDSFFLIGKAYFMKKEYFEAIESFQYVYTRWKREPIADDALLWLIRCYTASGQYAKAQGGIDMAVSNKNFPKDKKGELQALRAELLINQKRYDQAIEPLQQTDQYKFSKQQQARFHFILGQIYMQNNPRMAGAQFRVVLKKKPYYEMQFQSRMNIARLYDGKTVTAKQARNQLKKLLKDEKNKEYYDEIYFELAMLSFKDRQIDEGIAYLKLSTASSQKNMKQKTKSYLTLAEHFFKKQDYSTAQLYYDSTARVIDKEHPKYREVQGKKDYLGDLVKNLKVIAEQDSLVALGKLPEQELNKLIDKALKDERKRKDQARFEKEAGAMTNMQPQGGQQQRGGGAPGGMGGGSEWYFYNQQIVGSGFGQFLQQWGNRELADDWRRSKKDKVMVDAGATDGDVINFDENLDDADPRSKYLARIPRSDKALARSKELVQEALFNLGGLYREKLDDYPRSISFYEKLLAKYGGYTKEDEALYRLGLVYELENKEELKAARHNRLIQEYPESPFAKLLTNPEDIHTEESDSDEACEALYDATYRLFQQGDYKAVMKNYTEATSSYPSNKLSPHFEFLNAMSTGRASDSAAMKQALQALIGKYPEHEISKLATEILEMMDPAKRAIAMGDATAQLFKAISGQSHYFILAIDLRTYSQHKEVQLKLANFNDANFSNRRLRVTTMLYGKEYQLLVVRELPDERRAMEYYRIAIDHNELLKGLPVGKFHTFIAAKDNYNDLYKNNQLEEYLSFHTQYYLKPKQHK